MHSFVVACIAYAAIFTVAQSLQEYEFAVTREYLTPDCVEKLVLTVNGQFPGPEVRVSAGEEVVITVHNNLPTEALSIHWHGQHQIGTPFQDGVSKISQCPTPPYSSFTYRFTANEEPGTYFYHVHTGGMIEGGAFGAFIVEAASSDYDAEYTMIVAGNYHRNGQEGIFNVLSAAGAFRWVFEPNSILVNGNGVFDCFDNYDYVCDSTNSSDPFLCTDRADASLNVCGAHQRSYTRFRGYGAGGCDNGGENCGYEEFSVTGGQNVLFRIINPSSLSHLNIKFEGHTTTVVATDAYPVQPIVVDSIDLHSGQRVDVAVTMDGASDRAYWIGVRTRSRAGDRFGAAIIRYEGNTVGDPSNVAFDAMEQPAWDDYAFTRDQQNAFVGTTNPPANDLVAERFLMLHTQERFDTDNGVLTNVPADAVVSDLQSMIGAEGSGDRPEDNCESNDNAYKLRWAMNRATFQMPNTPSLLHNVFRSESFEAYAAARPFSYMKIERDRVYDIVLQNYPACNGVCETHPIHLHGHTMWQLGYFQGEWTGSQAQIGALCTENCPVRDTTFLVADATSINPRQGCGYTVVRFIADSPGVWPIHCHQSWHFVIGKMGIIYYDAAEIELPQNMSDLTMCGEVTVADIYEKYNTDLVMGTTEACNCSLDDTGGDSADGVSALGAGVGWMISCLLIVVAVYN